jgi:hypothetical protein
LTHAAIIVPPGSNHWFPSPAIFTGWPDGTFNYRVDVIENPGVFNGYGLQIRTNYSCTGVVSG